MTLALLIKAARPFPKTLTDTNLGILHSLIPDIPQLFLFPRQNPQYIGHWGFNVLHDFDTCFITYPIQLQKFCLLFMYIPRGKTFTIIYLFKLTDNLYQNFHLDLYLQLYRLVPEEGECTVSMYLKSLHCEIFTEL